MRINFGCGRRVLPGWVNIDAIVNPKAPRPPEIMYAMEFQCGALVAPIPLSNECADVLQAMHVIEHFYRYDADAVVVEWNRLLKPGGRLILELPNLEAACRNLLAGMTDQMSYWPLYGDPTHLDPYMTHRWGYTPKTIRTLLADNGFNCIEIKPPQTHGRRNNRDMRVEAFKA